jgi:hypothetical protein
MMSKRTDDYLRGVPMKPYDLLREGLIVLGIVGIIVVGLAVIFGSPDYPTVRSEDVAKQQPVDYLRTTANNLAGNSSIDGYGPPYTNDKANAQEILGIAPANWFGRTNPINPAQDFVLKPLARVAQLNPDVANALQTYQDATPSQQQTWLNAYLSALDTTTVNADSQVALPEGDYGPVETLMNGMLDLGRAGLLEGALESNARLPYSLNFTRSLLYFQDDVYNNVAEKLDLTGTQWGISHETGDYPGSWWLWPYTFLYQIEPIASSANADLLVGVIMLVFFLIIMLMPFIPGLNRLPHWLKVYRLIWRDWYQRSGRS